MVIGAYDPIIAEASRRFGVPEERIRAIMQVESGGRDRAVSPKGAAGLMQIMPDTYTDLARRHGLGPDRFDPRNNIFGGTAYLGEMYDQFGNWDEATQAYNMGPGRAMRVRNGAAKLPAETAAYGPKVNAVLATFGQTPPQTPQEATVPLFTGPRAGSLTGLLEVDESKNFSEGLGPLLNFGQEPSQPPRTDPAALPGTTQTDRLGLSSQINELLEKYLQQPQKAMPSQLQYMLAGAQKGVQPLAGVHDRKVGIGEMLGALGGGVTSGYFAGEEAQQQSQGAELDRVYKAAQIQKAMAPESDADRYKVVGKHIYDTRTKQFTPAPGGVDQSGPLEGTGPEAQFTNAYIMLEQKRASGQPLSQQEQLLYDASVRFLNKPKVVAGPDGVVREVAPAPLPTLNGAGAGTTAAPAPTPNETPPAPGQAPAPAPPPANPPRVTEIVPPRPKEIPATVQTSMLTNVAGLRKLDSALAALEKAPGATGYGPGILNMLPGQTVNRVLPEGAEARAALADIGSMVIHDRSGAAVTIGEMEKLKPFIPTIYDDEASVKMKLGRLRTEIEDILRDQSTTYSSDQAYKENPVVQDVLKNLRPRAPMSGGEGGAGPKVMRFDAKGNLIQ